MKTAIGIDLGMSNTCAAYSDASGTRVILDKNGSNVIPSYIARNAKGKLFIGHLAKQQVISNPFQTIFGTKRLIGRRYADEASLIAREFFPYAIKEGANGEISIALEGETYTAVEVGALILKKAKKNAEQFLGRPVEQAVITVPAYFNDAQRLATRQAGEIAGFEVLRLINEPTAAALAYGSREGMDGRRIAVFDLGGGTFDVSILSITKDSLDVLATGGDSYLGGVDFDNRLVEYVVKEFQKSSGIDLTKDKMALQRIKDAAEGAKHELSGSEKARILLPFIVPYSEAHKHLDIEVTRKLFHMLTNDLIERCITICDRVLTEAKLGKGDLDELMVVGGQTRMPRIRQMIRDYFGIEPKMGVSPDEAVAMGASIHAWTLTRQGAVAPDALAPAPLPDETPVQRMRSHDPEAPNIVPLPDPEPAAAESDAEHPFTIEEGSQPVVVDSPYVPPPVHGNGSQTDFFAKILRDVTPLSLGIEVCGGVNYVLIPRNTRVPVSITRTFTTARDNQPSVRVRCTQGEVRTAEDNVFLGEVVLDMETPNRRAESQVDVTFHLNTDGIMQVNAVEKRTSRSQAIRIEARTAMSAEETARSAGRVSQMEIVED